MAPRLATTVSVAQVMKLQKLLTESLPNVRTSTSALRVPTIVTPKLPVLTSLVLLHALAMTAGKEMEPIVSISTNAILMLTTVMITLLALIQHLASTVLATLDMKATVLTVSTSMSVMPELIPATKKQIAKTLTVASTVSALTVTAVMATLASISTSVSRVVPMTATQTLSASTVRVLSAVSALTVGRVLTAPAAHQLTTAHWKQTITVLMAVALPALMSTRL